MQPLDADALKVRLCLTDEIRVAPAERLKIRKQVHVGNGHVRRFGEHFEAVEHRPAHVGPCQRFAIPLEHGVDVRIKRRGLFHHCVDVRGVRAHHDGRLLGDAEFLQPIFDARNDRLRKPLCTVARAQRLAQRHHQAGVRILAYKF